MGSLQGYVPFFQRLNPKSRDQKTTVNGTQKKSPILRQDFVGQAGCKSRTGSARRTRAFQWPFYVSAGFDGAAGMKCSPTFVVLHPGF
jgi:hypothetical protein